MAAESGGAASARRPVRVYSLCLLYHGMPELLVERHPVSWAGHSPARASLDLGPPAFGNRLARVQVLRARLRTVEYRVPAIQPERIFDLVKPLAGCLVAAVQEPPM